MHNTLVISAGGAVARQEVEGARWFFVELNALARHRLCDTKTVV
jgi:hypothetical protein